MGKFDPKSDLLIFLDTAHTYNLSAFTRGWSWRPLLGRCGGRIIRVLNRTTAAVVEMSPGACPGSPSFRGADEPRNIASYRKKIATFGRIRILGELDLP
jgi:hypothetical protein